MLLRLLLHGEQQQGEEQRENAGCMARRGIVPRVRVSVANGARIHNARRTEPAAYIFANVGAMTCGAMPMGAGSSTVIRHSVRASFGSISVAECSSDALSQMTTSPTPYLSE